jgi:hypothetical protein
MDHDAETAPASTLSTPAAATVPEKKTIAILKKTKEQVTEDEVKDYMENFKKSIKKPKPQHTAIDDEFEQYFQDDAFCDSPLFKPAAKDPPKEAPPIKPEIVEVEPTKPTLSEVKVAEKKVAEPKAKKVTEVEVKKAEQKSPVASPIAQNAKVAPETSSTQAEAMAESEFDNFDVDQYMDEADEAIFKEIINQNKVRKG